MTEPLRHDSPVMGGLPPAVVAELCTPAEPLGLEEEKRMEAIARAVAGWCRLTLAEKRAAIMRSKPGPVGWEPGTLMDGEVESVAWRLALAGVMPPAAEGLDDEGQEEGAAEGAHEAENG